MRKQFEDPVGGGRGTVATGKQKVYLTVHFMGLNYVQRSCFYDETGA